MAEVKAVSKDGIAVHTEAADLPALHETIASLFAAQGNWERAYQHLRSALERDALTAGYNRRFLDQQLARLADGHLSLAMVDIDLFKHVNDTFGHLIGDRVLRSVAALLKQDLPRGAFCARYGGEEFVLVMPGLDAREALSAVERARLRVARYAWHRVRPGLTVTVSAGLTARPGPAEERLREADALLYAAKRAGRNVVAYPDSEIPGQIRHSG
ncbi:GGDEF domain-containing protein [Amycolatopsis sp. YIM 10]|uniref:GGDEF domain-containing protein n=1 Tax=Amycolatopsis sp. YIM 10 TaxID=2653857 RepID=UPI00129072B2|nr:GGDEF domain-containing protein [Amycolatopsis sp. YIM 10]